MKKQFLLIILILLTVNVFTQNKQLRAYLSYATFDMPGQQAYIETYLAAEAGSVVFKAIEEGKYQAAIEVTMVFMQNDSVRNFAKYELKSPIIEDTNMVNFGILDQQRFSLPDGEYLLNLEISDKNNPKVLPFITTEQIDLFFNENDIQLSAIQLVEKFEKSVTESIITKNGFDLIPLVYAYYPESSKQLNFYTEVYNSNIKFGNEGKFLVSYYIESFEGMNKLKDYLFRKRVDAREVNVLLHSIDITQLPSGNYNLVVEVRDQKNEVVTLNKVFFQRNNPSVQFNVVDIASVNITNTFADKITNADTLREMLQCIAPIASESDRDYAYNLSKTSDLHTMRQFLFNFWQNRNFENPEAAWIKYNQEVQKVNASYKTQTKKGYASDRGRVYLKYGAPNHIVEAYSEPAAYPYEIWHYYTLGSQRNKRFVFVTKDMVTNDFALIHSDAIGELSNYRWQLEIYKRTWDPNNIDDTGPEDAFGNKAYDFYKNPR
ncbi:MAG: hypothetical protein FD155_2651 [Bacteroidetes bacterium]|nr:MAG: hypothetical protein FD155_2651 [Bacteroidota bacterium]